MQRRVAQFGMVACLLGLFFWLFRLSVILLSGEYAWLQDGSLRAHLAGVAAYAFIWLSLSFGPRSATAIQVTETVGVMGSVIAYQLMGTYIPIVGGAWLVVTLALTYGFVARSVFVPSSGRLTFALTAMSGIPLVWLCYRGHAQDLEAARLAAQYLPGIAVEGEVDMERWAMGSAIGIAIWWSLTVTLCTAASKVIYGLRRQVHSAMQLGQYQLVEKIGEGGMGKVYRARHALLKRPTVVKLLPPDKAGDINIARFEREVQMTAELRHPNTVTIYDYGKTPDGVFYYAMEYLPGADLETIVETAGPLAPERVVHILLQLSGALAEAHSIQLIHRDIKPANIILGWESGVGDVAKLVDFGLVKQLSGQDATLTGTHVLTGTPLFMAPETIAGPDQTDERSDLYAVGAVAYYLLAGEHVFNAASVVEICSHHLHTPPRPIQSVAEVPDDLAQVVMALLSKAPEDRPATATALREALRGTGLAHRWTEAEAEAWWAKHRESLRRSHGTLSTDHAFTLPVAPLDA